ncbi:glutamine-serine-proline rich protein, putative [Trichophyton benhamiae CBS 112371]|uniref:Glutamine-serine-proline rich protein, putative n=1 Tax=Arthroderma benhamiae (strain ATCC MYA-4681 / CBS 112371) TaxID=663331 RepID=D4AVR0_ARTBC|nr:glutamine-serine-proline rich protein, putative [Trichophyton benhamiae CBS 112371]EFE32816.1 glutamine-serine-proline rich protein, putative [Trichophyton benhamiae CBS 112371]
MRPSVGAFERRGCVVQREAEVFKGCPFPRPLLLVLLILPTQNILSITANTSFYQLPPPTATMSFHESAREVRIEDEYFLVAELRNDNGDYVTARLDLNSVLGNFNGNFSWGERDFSNSASNIWLQFDEAINLPILRATLTTSGGDQVARDVNLAERIANNNGCFELQ